MTRTAEPRHLEFERNNDNAAPTHIWVQGRRFALTRYDYQYIPDEIMTPGGYLQVGREVEFTFRAYADDPPPPRKPRTASSLGLRRPK